MAFSGMSKCGIVDSGLGSFVCGLLPGFPPQPGSHWDHLLTLFVSSIIISGVGIRCGERPRDWVKVGQSLGFWHTAWCRGRSENLTIYFPSV